MVVIFRSTPENIPFELYFTHGKFTSVLKTYKKSTALNMIAQFWLLIIL